MHWRALIGVLMLAAFFACCAQPSGEQGGTPEKYYWRWATLDPGGYGYRVSAQLVDILKYEMPEVEFSILPYSSTTANIKDFCKGNAESTYIADLGFQELYMFTGAFKDFRGEVKQMPVQTFWAYTMETFILIPKDKAGEIKSWKDLDGKKVFLTPAGYMNYLNIQRALKAVGVNVSHVEIDTRFTCKALEEGTIVATALYTTAKFSPPTWGKEADIACGAKLVPLNPSEEEIAKLMESGLLVVEINASEAFTNVKGKIYGVPFFFGFHVSKDMPESLVYKMLVSLEKNAEKLAKAEKGFEPLAKDFVGFQIDGIKSTNPELVPIHPVLAKFLKERNAWNEDWDAYIAKGSSG